MKTIVFGGKGFVGSNLVERLKGEGHEVLAPSREMCDTTNFDDVNYWMKDCDIVFNCVALANLHECLMNPLLSYKTTFMSAVNIMESALMRGVKRVVLSSSNIVYYETNPYKVAVECVERVALDYIKTFKQPIICLRYANIYGRRKPSKYRTTTVIDAFARQKHNDGKIVLMGDGEQTRDFIHISDVVEANLKAMKSEYRGIVDICTGVNTKLKDVAALFDCPVERIAQRKVDAKEIIQSPIPAQVRIGFTASVPLAEGIKDVVDCRQTV